MGDRLAGRVSSVRRLLVIDGDGLLWPGLHEPLRARGYDVRLARSFGEALLLLAEARFDLVVARQIVNRRDVWAVMKRLREVHGGPLLVVNFETRTGTATQAVGTAGGESTSDWDREIQAIVERVEAAATEPSAALASADAMVITVQHRPPRAPAEAWRGSAQQRTITTPLGHILPLTRASYALLAYLARRRGELVQRPELIEAYTGIVPGQQGSHVPEVVIAKLRAILEPHMEGREAIQTVYGQGYVFTGFDLVEEDEPRPQPRPRHVQAASLADMQTWRTSVVPAWRTSRRAQTVTTADGYELHLARREYRVLALLAARRGSVVPRAELAQACHRDGNGMQNSRVVDMVICSLRTILVPHMQGRPAIQTVRRAGYALTGFDLVEEDEPHEGQGASDEADRTSHDPGPVEHISEPDMVRGG